MAAVKPEKPEEPRILAAVKKLGAKQSDSAVSDSAQNAPSRVVRSSASSLARTEAANAPKANPTPAQKAAHAKTASETQTASAAKKVSETKKGSKANNASETENTAESGDHLKNPTKRIIDEMVSLMGEVHEGRAELLARGVPFHTTNVMVEFGVQGKLEEQKKMRSTALEASRKQHGGAAITEDMLEEHLDTLVNLEKDLGHVRRLARQQGMNMAAINNLTMIIRQNPGDGGEKVINTFLAYALACDIPLKQMKEIFEAANEEPKSVLPDIPRDEDVDKAATARRRLYIDIAIGCAMALLALSLLA